MGAMLKQLWATLAALFAAGETLGHAMQGGAKALDHPATWSEETAGSFADRAREERKQAMSILQQQTNRAAVANGLPTAEVPAITQQ